MKEFIKSIASLKTPEGVISADISVVSNTRCIQMNAQEFKKLYPLASVKAFSSEYLKRYMIIEGVEIMCLDDGEEAV